MAAKMGAREVVRVVLTGRVNGRRALARASAAGVNNGGE